MENLLGRVEAYLSEIEIEVSDDLIFLINSRIKPPVPVKKEDIYIRAMYLVSDQVNSFGGCFPLDEHPKLAELLVDSPVLVGHSKERLPIARNFKADLVKKDDVNWVKVYFYWLKNSPEANSLKENIDHGIYKECSIGFSFEFPECSICGEDMRRCQHIPFRTYEKENGEKTQAFYNYRNIIKVHETSLVYRGAVFGTSMTNELYLFQKHDCADGFCKFKRAYKESILESLKKAGIEKEVKLAGDIEEKGYSDNKIQLSCENNLEEKVLSSIPQIFRDRVCFVSKERIEKDKIQSSRFILSQMSLSEQNHPEENTVECNLIFEGEEVTTAICIHRLNMEKLEKGRRFLCDFKDFSKIIKSESGEVLDTGEYQTAEGNKEFFRFKLEGEILNGVYFARKIKLKDQDRWLFFKRMAEHI
ncbi:MAG: hypothetical protein MUO78_02190 [candidate division Zixibacteria bacterium]|nr:hypothetical protein [candidate division Zixibacteria bacterium]